MKRLVVKVGTSTLTGGGTGLDCVFIDSLAAQIAAQRQLGRQVVLVTSGAIQVGLGALGLPGRPGTTPMKQAAASIGQPELMARYAEVFRKLEHGAITVGQVLLTWDDLRNQTRYVNARNTFTALLTRGVLPIVNENDAVATDEIGVGDNDTLAALVTSLLGADALVLLTDVGGLYDKDPALHPDARLVERVDRIDGELHARAGGAGTAVGTGGMRTKLAAARIATRSGAAMWIAPGHRENVIADCLAHRPGTGTFFQPAPIRASARKRWIAIAWAADEPRGTVIVNARARHALEEAGGSLLPVGIVGLSGDWNADDLVAVADETGEAFARGIARYAAHEVKRIKGRPTGEIAAALDLAPDAPAPRGEVIHRDQLVLC